MSGDVTYIVYDGECPFCSAFVKMLRLKEAMGPVELIDARSGHEVVAMLVAGGYDLDEGMALVRDFGKPSQSIAHGDECVHQLALMTTPSNFFNRVNATVFRSKGVSRALYPFMRAGRNTVLRLLGRRKLADTPVGE